MSLLVCCLLLAPDPAPDRDVFEITTRSFRLPVMVDPARRKEIRAIILHVSRDKGKTWSVVAQIGPDQTEFRYDSPQDGLYWFAVQVHQTDNTFDPAHVKDFDRFIKVLVRTGTPGP